MEHADYTTRKMETILQIMQTSDAEIQKMKVNVVSEVIV